MKLVTSIFLSVIVGGICLFVGIQFQIAKDQARIEHQNKKPDVNTGNISGNSGATVIAGEGDIYNQNGANPNEMKNAVRDGIIELKHKVLPIGSYKLENIEHSYTIENPIRVEDVKQLIALLSFYNADSIDEEFPSEEEIFKAIKENPELLKLLELHIGKAIRLRPLAVKMLGFDTSKSARLKAIISFKEDIFMKECALYFSLFDSYQNQVGSITVFRYDVDSSNDLVVNVASNYSDVKYAHLSSVSIKEGNRNNVRAKPKLQKITEIANHEESRLWKLVGKILNKVQQPNWVPPTLEKDSDFSIDSLFGELFAPEATDPVPTLIPSVYEKNSLYDSKGLKIEVEKGALIGAAAGGIIGQPVGGESEQSIKK